MGVRFAVDVRRLIVAATTLAEARGRSRPRIRDLLDAIVSIGEPMPAVLPELLEDDLEEVLGIASNLAGDGELDLRVLVPALTELRRTNPQDAAHDPRGSAAHDRRVPSPVAGVRIGMGYDSHTLAAGGPMVLGGVRIPIEFHCAGHSDGDAVCHALTDAVLGGAGAGDIGEMFPNTDPANKGRNSVEMLSIAVDAIRDRGYTVINVDVTVIAEKPKIGPHREAMSAALATALGIDVARVSVKGKTNEGMGWIGAGEGIAAIAVATLMHEPR